MTKSQLAAAAKFIRNFADVADGSRVGGKSKTKKWAKRVARRIIRRAENTAADDRG